MLVVNGGGGCVGCGVGSFGECAAVVANCFDSAAVRDASCWISTKCTIERI